MPADLETISVLAVVTFAGALLAWRARQAETRWIRLCAPTLLVVPPCGAAWSIADLGLTAQPPVIDRPVKVANAGYISSDACRSCHPQEYHTWHPSYHRTMTQVATTENVAPQWSGSVQIRGETIRLEREGNDLWIALVTCPHLCVHIES